MTAKENALNWFEIPVLNMERARNFYETIFGIKMHQMDMMNTQMAGFPGEELSGKVSGALVQSPSHHPSSTGIVIYLNGNPDLAIPLGKVEASGGKILMPKTKITEEIGYMAFISDTEGNNIGLHSNK